MSNINTPENFSNPLSYKTIRNLISQFRKSGGAEGSDFNLFETPGQFYFKILFYFDNPNDSSFTSNLLGCDWIVDELADIDYNSYSESTDPQRKPVNSAYNYLKINDENERAEKLKKFIYLLSDINSQSPWYFTTITGLDTALDRKTLTDRDFKIEEERKSITIKCLPDAYDNRIGTLLDLYRDVCYSYVNKKEIIPANLRKFDMGIFIFNTPNKNIHGSYDGNPKLWDAHISSLGYENSYRTSSKYIELHNCEIDYNSSKNVYSELNNQEGNIHEYEIIIKFDDAYENRYNEFMLKEIGDFVKTDLLSISNNTTDDTYYDELFNKDSQNNIDILSNFRLNKNNPTIYNVHQSDSETIANIDANNMYGLQYNAPKYNSTTTTKIGANNMYGLQYNAPKYNSTILTQIAGNVINKAETLIEHIYLGNMYGLSLSKVKDLVGDILQGNIFNTINAVQDYAEHINGKKLPNYNLEGKKLWEPVNTSDEPQLRQYQNKKFPGYAEELQQKQSTTLAKSLRNNI